MERYGPEERLDAHPQEQERELVTKLKTQHPNAEFSTDSPFTLLTTEEFAAYIKNSFIAAGATAAPVAIKPRRLREELESESSSPSVTSTHAPKLRSLATTDGKTAVPPSITRPATPATTRPTPAATRPVPPVPAPTPVTGPAKKTSTPKPSPTPTPTTTAPTTTAPTTTTSTPTPSTTTPATAPPSVDWSVGKCMPPVQNQGQCGSCWSFASVAAVESAQCIATGSTTLTKLSEQTLTSCDTRNSGCNGGVPLYAMQYIQLNGLCTLANDPYTAGTGVLAKCNTACTKVKTGMKGVQSLAQTESALLAALVQRPVVVAVQAGNDAWKQYKSGVLSACLSATASIDHAVVAVGYDATTIKIRNSWSASWGEAGYIRLARSTAGLGTCKLFQQMTVATF